MERVRTQVGVPILDNEYKEEKRITVAVLDTGVGNHPDLAGKVICFRDFVGNNKTMYDDNGHGTHISGIICGSGCLSGGKMRGIAPGSNLVVGKVLDHKGEGMTRHMLDALDWILKIKNKYEIRVLNISVGIGEMKDKRKEELLCRKIEEIWEEGIIVVCAAGNKGPQDGSISAVCRSEKVITVGCHDGNYLAGNPKRCAVYSGRGQGNSVIRKPDVVAPGTEIRSCNVHYKKVYGQFSEKEIQNAYITKSGTSMATPIVSGAIVLLLQKYPNMSNEDVKRKVTYTATDLGEPWNMQGWGMINVKKMLERY